MTLSIAEEINGIRNPYALSADEAAQVQAWQNMTDDEQGEYLFRAKQAEADQAYLDSAQLNDFVNGNTVQRLATGGAVVGGELRPDALVTIGGMEMTVQQAVNAGIYDSSVLGMHTADMEERPENDQDGELAGVAVSETFVNDYGQVLHIDADDTLWLYDEASNEWFEAEDA